MACDRIENHPLFHFRPGALLLQPRVLSPGSILAAALDGGATCVSLPADPGPHGWHVIEVARACRERGLHAVGAASGHAVATLPLDVLGAMDAATVDLTSVLDQEASRRAITRLSRAIDPAKTWLELLVRFGPGARLSDRSIDTLSREIAERLGPDVPLHLVGRGLGEDEALISARWIAISNGLHWVYADDRAGAGSRASCCPGCDALLIVRSSDEVRIGGLLDAACASCGWAIPGMCRSAS